MKLLQHIKIAFSRLMTNLHRNNNDTENISYTNLTRTMMKCALSNYGWPYEFNDENDCFYCEISDSDKPTVILTIKPGANYIYTQAFVVKQPVTSLALTDALLFCNKWNSKSILPKAYIEPSTNSLIAETFMTFGKEASEEFFRKCLLENLFVSTVAFFEEAAKEKFFSGAPKETKLQE